MNIVYVSNENYVRHLAVSVVSLLENNEAEEEIKIYVISTGISELSKTKLNKLVHSYQREIEILNLADLKIIQLIRANLISVLWVDSLSGSSCQKR